MRLFQFDDDSKVVVAANSLQEATQYLRSTYEEADHSYFDEKIKGKKVDYSKTVTFEGFDFIPFKEFLQNMQANQPSIVCWKQIGSRF